jgi:hypothetical protein
LQKVADNDADYVAPQDMLTQLRDDEAERRVWFLHETLQRG